MRVSFSHSLSTPSHPTPSLFLNSFRSELLWEVFCFLFHVVILIWLVLFAFWTGSFFVCLSLSVIILLLWQKKNGNDWDLASYCPLPRSVWQLLSMCRWKHKCFFTQFWHSFKLMEKFEFFTRVNCDLNEYRLITYFHFFRWSLSRCERNIFYLNLNEILAL